MVAGLIAVGDVDVLRANKMRKAAAIAFHEADCDQALRSATLSGPRKPADFEAGQAVFFFRSPGGEQARPRSYTLGKNQRGKGRFTGKDIELQLDGSMKINQEFYIKDR